MITPAMLEEEEQLEAAGLERERKMLEKVTSGMKFVDLKARGNLMLLPWGCGLCFSVSPVWFFSYTLKWALLLILRVFADAICEKRLLGLRLMLL